MNDDKIDELIEILNLKTKMNSKGKTIYKTLWGDKTFFGVREIIKNVLEVKK